MMANFLRSTRFILALATGLCAFAAHAADPVRLVVPFAAGGTQDLMARVIQNALGQALGEPIIVENRAGAGGTVGTATVAASAPNGKTLALVASNHASNPWLYPKMPYDALASFAPVAMIGKTGFALVVSSALPVHTVAELVDYAKRHPNQLNYASAGNGSNGHLGMALFAQMAGIQLQHIPFKSTGEAMTDVLAGRSHLIMPATIGAVLAVSDKRARILGMTSKVGHTGMFANFPLVADAGVQGFNYDAWYGLLAPAGTPRARIEQLHAAAEKAMRQDSVRDALQKAGIEPALMGPNEFAAFLAADYAETGKLVKSTGARLE
ncbi:tripartite tricarboxylate transporter substrate binding protein [Pigmentiphaga sp. H8]|uniref:Bug family tripartite tricarboxylate transporter substrate binding protein n=1 Tax=Pigmentiphaga sp. H8 TaxID=2488560 RepID=UPI0013764657|nr:tripartite tricarboxylate transporter substrate-binding protein [Pigmentiphaga sp. H8]